MLGRSQLRFGAVLVGITLVACGGDSSGPSSTGLDQATAGVIGEEAANQIGALAAGITNFGMPSTGPAGGLFLRSAPAGRLLTTAAQSAHPALQRAVSSFTSRAGNCDPAVSDSTDSDADGVPDNAVLTFNCSFTDDSGYTSAITGTVTVTDPAGSLFGYDVGFDRFTLSTTIPTQQGDQELQFQFDGNTGVDVQADGATAGEDLTWRTRLNGDRILLVSNTWNVSFTPTGGTIDPSAGVAPAGTFSVNGLFSWVADYQGNGGSWGFGIQTTAPLVYDGACTDPQWPFESGSIRGLISGNQNVGFTVDYQGCGVMPTVTVFGAGA